MQYGKTNTISIQPVELPKGSTIEGFWLQGSLGARNPFGRCDAGFWTVDAAGLHTFRDKEEMTNHWDQHQ